MNRLKQDSQQKKITRRIIAITIDGVIVFLLLFLLFFDANSFLNVSRAKKEYKKIYVRTEELKDANQELKKQIKAVDDNPQMWEKLAREKYGMQKSDEKIYHFVDPE